MRLQSIKKVTCGVLIAAMVLSVVPFSANATAAKKASLKTKKVTVQVGKTAKISLKNKVAKNTYNIPKGLDIEFLKYPIHWTLTIRNPLS